MPRELSKAEQEYIKSNHSNMSADDMCADMPGVGPKTVENFIETSVMPEAQRGETPQERQDKIKKKTGLTAGKLMARDPELGIAAMTAGAAELSDIRRTSNAETAKAQNSRIHIMDPSKEVR